jgi:hypothetical protein
MRNLNQDNRHTDRARFTVIDQRNQNVTTQYNSVDQRNQRFEYQYFYGDQRIESVLRNQNHPGVVFQQKVIYSWLILWIVSVCCLIVSSSLGGTTTSITAGTFGIFASYAFYGFLGLVIQSIYCRCRLNAVRNYWLVWYFYPLISLFGIALWFVWIMLRPSLWFFRSSR